LNAHTYRLLEEVAAKRCCEEKRGAAQ